MHTWFTCSGYTYRTFPLAVVSLDMMQLKFPSALYETALWQHRLHVQCDAGAAGSFKKSLHGRNFGQPFVNYAMLIYLQLPSESLTLTTWRSTLMGV